VPQRYLDQLQQFYQASHDFRLLARLPDAVIGHTAERVYPFVQGMQSVLEDVRDEATADEIVKRIAEVRPRAKTAVDQRALDLLEALVERRAAEVQNQPGPHRDKALTAMQRAFKGEWSQGEPRLMADFLAGLGNITQPALADEQLRQLKALHAGAAAGSIDRLRIAHRYASALHDHNAAAAIDVLQAALDEFQAAHDGVLPVVANDALASFIHFVEGAGHFARAEKLVFAQLAHPAHAQQRLWLVLRLDELYHHALAKDGEVSLGKGLMLYQALNAKIQKDLAEPGPLKRYQLAELLCKVYRTAQEKKLPGVAADLKAFAFEIAPPLVNGLTSYHPSIVSTIANTVHDLAGPRDGIVFLLSELDSEPRWLRYNHQDGWTQHGHTLAQWRHEAKDLGDVEGRLLKRVLAELRRDLETREQRSRIIYLHGAGWFWKEKADDFAKTAESVLAERGKSGPAVEYIADYFYWGLGKGDRAIEILFVARNQKLLEEAGEATLVYFLQREHRYAESIPILLPLVERRPAHLDYRVFLMRASFRTARQAELRALLKETNAFFHAKDRWGEDALNRLAHSTLENELYEQSIAYFKELIPLHERTQPNRGIGNGTLSGYYAGLANAYAGLKKTSEAVEAAGGAIVAWGSRRDNRVQALDTLKQVLLRSPDLDGFVAHFDQQKQDSAIVRKALGRAYRDKKEHAKAIQQLQQAAQLQANDAEVHQLLVASYDDIGEKEGAVQQLLQAALQSRRDLKLYQDLGNRYAAAGRGLEAERAYTSIVEVLPGEAESHALLAEVREKQNRWPEAIHHWEQAARLRALEPTGLLKLAATQILEKQWDQARATLRKLDARTWPARFGDVSSQVRTLTEALAKQSKQ
jgi:Flp pilus assembly protein TadD